MICGLIKNSVKMICPTSDIIFNFNKYSAKGINCAMFNLFLETL